ncbi:MAG: hypothetical protein Kow0077_14450 [Anaerolineae bacterium]
MQIVFSDHAIERCHQRNLSPDEVAYVIAHGRRYYCNGALYFSLGKRDIPACDRRDQRISQLVGLHVVTQQDGDDLVVTTAFRNRKKPFGPRQRRTRSCKQMMI